MKYFFLLSIFLLASCTKKHELTKSRGLYYIDNFELAVSRADEINWRVGRKRDKDLSQGFIFQVEIPKISSDTAELLYNKYEVDSWIYKVTKVSRGRKRTLGYVDYKIHNTFSSSDRFSIKVLYHAASISDSFRRFHCPAFNHRLKIKDIGISELQLRRRRLYTRSSNRIKGRIDRPSFNPIQFSGGRKLKGTYVVSIALFKSKEKRVFGDFVPLTTYVDIKDETKVSLPSCIGIKEEVNPLPESRSPTLKDLKFN